MNKKSLFSFLGATAHNAARVDSKNFGKAKTALRYAALP
jgi:hypothetical protein